MELIKNKRGIFFTALVLAMLSLFVITYSFSNFSDERKTVQKRVETMNNFLFSLEEDMPRQIFIFGFRTIFLAEREIIESGNYIPNIDSLVNEAFFIGTINGDEEAILEGATLDDLIQSIQDKADKINVIVNLTDASMEISQEDPWNVKFTLTAQLTMTDKSGLASWQKEEIIEAFVPIKNFDDPVYYVGTNGRVINKINKTIYNNFVSGSDVTNLSSHAENSLYINNTDAPSFLDRLEGNITASSPYGIESIVNLEKLSTQGVIAQQKSVIDHIYFSSQDPSWCKVAGMQNWFRIDLDHENLYEVPELTENCET